ncbi:MAG TPA: hypothetical protein H9736_09405 [Candidatus Anaerotruncus excrementipullorum]|uniref:Uncharacterized protein n=1 Tax=Candidatus Anaerotruncus excrementipullorum TaxID=2838465 RepID=A0A9D1WTA9_9FIRM|nr:hypothetical protein [Candidatus Anaerotruncus excrementipullorum]
MKLKKQFAALFCALLIAILSACGQSGGSSQASASQPASSAAASQAESEAPAEESVPEEADAEAAPVEPLAAPEGSQVFRGTVEDFAVSDDGATVLLMRRAVGTSFPADLKVKLIADGSADTQFGMDADLLGNGSFLEVYYTPGQENPDGSVTALVVNDALSEDLVYYNGTVVEVAPDPEQEGEGYLLLDPLEEGGMQYRFNYGPETQFVIPLEQIAVGTQLNVYHSPAATRSLPPQSYALEVSAYTAPAEGEVPAPVADPAAPVESDPVATPSAEETAAPTEVLSPVTG